MPKLSYIWEIFLGNMQEREKHSKMNFRDLSFRGKNDLATQTLRKETLHSFLLISIGVSLFWLIIDLIFWNPLYIWFAAAPIFYMAPALILNQKGHTSFGWPLVLICSTILISTSPLIFDPLVALMLILFVIYQSVSLGFQSAQIKYFYIVFLGICIIGFLTLCYISPNEGEKAKIFIANLLISAVAIVFMTAINRIQSKEFLKIKKKSIESREKTIQSEERYRTLFEASPAGIVILDLNGGGPLDCNRKMLELFEAEKEDILAGSPLDFSPEYQPDKELSSEKYLRLLKEYKAEPKTLHHNWQYLTKSGKPFDAEVILTPIHINGEKLAIQQIQDVSQKIEAEREKNKIEIYYRTLFANGYDGIIIFDLIKRRPHSCNQVVLDMLGIKEEEFSNFDFLQFAPEKQSDGRSTKSFILHYIEKVQKEGKVQFDWLQHDKNGKAFYTEVSAFALPEPESNFAFVIFKDTTEKIITQRALETVSRPVIRGREQNFFDDITRSIAEFLQVSIVLVGKLQKDKKGMEAKGLWFKDQNISGISYVLEHTPCDQVVITQEMKCYPSRIRELFPKDKDLEDWNAESYLAYPLFNAAKEMIGHFAVMDNKPLINKEIIHTTMKIFATALASELEREEHQLELEQSNKELKMVNSELDRFVYSAAHDIRAPISSVLGLINISEEQEDLSVIKHYLKLQKSSLKKLDLFITDLINYSINKRRNIVREQILIDDLIDEVIDQYRYLENFKKVHIEQKIEVYEPLLTDGNRLKLILNNLLSNAIHYADIGKPNPQILLSIQILQDKATFEVWDNGQGIPPNHIDRIFEMFHRASKYSKGSGIGLYITKEAVEKLGGEIKVESVHKEWTRFYFEITNQLHVEKSMETSN